MKTYAERHKRVFSFHLPNDEGRHTADTDDKHSDDVAGLPLLLGRAGNGEWHKNESEYW